MRLALYQPDIPQNAGTMLRLAACLGVAVDLIEPAGFVMSDKHLRRAGMDYLEHTELVRHRSWQAYIDQPGRQGRLILLTTRASVDYVDFRFAADDTLMVGRESDGVPDDVHRFVDAAVRVPMVAQMRSLNVAAAAAMVLGEALRQTNQLPGTA
jgi:tRNA (cytidine/uridine-2'-O-)-methyltransferase